MPKHQLQSFGGVNAACVYSGAVAPAPTSGVVVGITGSDVQFASGPGRLAVVVPHQTTVFSLSGQAIPFYDAVAPISGGPLPTSGHVLLAQINAPFGVSGQGGAGAGAGIRVDMPFLNGLCYNSRSGQTGVTVSWTTDK